MIDPQRSKTWAVYRSNSVTEAWHLFCCDQRAMSTTAAPPLQGLSYISKMDRAQSLNSDSWFNNGRPYSENIVEVINNILADPSAFGPRDLSIRLVSALDDQDTRWLVWCPYE